MTFEAVWSRRVGLNPSISFTYLEELSSKITGGRKQFHAVVHQLEYCIQETANKRLTLSVEL